VIPQALEVIQNNLLILFLYGRPAQQMRPLALPDHNNSSREFSQITEIKGGNWENSALTPNDANSRYPQICANFLERMMVRISNHISSMMDHRWQRNST